MAGDKATIRFEGRTLTCRADTSVAAALWEAGVRHLSYSPKYGRPRGLTCARGHCTACLMRVDGVPNVRTCEVPVADGMVVQRQDAGAFYGPPLQKTLAAGGGLFPVGFYYKWFTRPAVLSRLFLRGIRPLTGVGRLPDGVAAPFRAPSTRDLGHHATIIVGAGAGGLSAARDADGPVLLIDENDALGGLRLAALDELAAGDHLDGFPDLVDARDNLRGLADTVAASDADVRLGARVVAGYHPGGLVLREGEDLLTASCGHLVWAAGALDAPGLFAGNDTPGVVGPRALLRLLLRDRLAVAGHAVILEGEGLDLWLAAALLEARGARPNILLTGDSPASEVAAAVSRRWPLHTGLELVAASGAGDAGLMAEFAPGPELGGARLRMPADLAVLCRRAKPVYDIPYQLGVDLELAPERGGFQPRGCTGTGWSTTVGDGPAVTFVGEAAGENPETVLLADRHREGS